MKEDPPCFLSKFTGAFRNCERCLPPSLQRCGTITTLTVGKHQPLRSTYCPYPGNGYIEGEELNDFLREFVSSVHNEESPEVGSLLLWIYIIVLFLNSYQSEI